MTKNKASRRGTVSFTFSETLKHDLDIRQSDIDNGEVARTIQNLETVTDSCGHATEVGTVRLGGKVLRVSNIEAGDSEFFIDGVA
jgi:hypothetical protein